MKSLLPKGGLEFHNTTPSPLLLYLQSQERTKALKSFFTGKQYCFIMSVVAIAWLLDVIRILISVYPFCIVVFCLSEPSLAAIDLAKRRAALRGSESRRSLSPLLALKLSKEPYGEWEVRGWIMSEMQNSFTFKHCLRRGEWEEPEWKRKLLITASAEIE